MQKGRARAQSKAKLLGADEIDEIEEPERISGIRNIAGVGDKSLADPARLLRLALDYLRGAFEQLELCDGTIAITSPLVLLEVSLTNASAASDQLRRSGVAESLEWHTVVEFAIQSTANGIAELQRANSCAPLDRLHPFNQCLAEINEAQAAIEALLDELEDIGAIASVR